MPDGAGNPTLVEVLNEAAARAQPYRYVPVYNYTPGAAPLYDPVMAGMTAGLPQPQQPMQPPQGVPGQQQPAPTPTPTPGPQTQVPQQPDQSIQVAPAPGPITDNDLQGTGAIPFKSDKDGADAQAEAGGGTVVQDSSGMWWLVPFAVMPRRPATPAQAPVPPGIEAQGSPHRALPGSNIIEGEFTEVPQPRQVQGQAQQALPAPPRALPPPDAPSAPTQPRGPQVPPTGPAPAGGSPTIPPGSSRPPSVLDQADLGTPELNAASAQSNVDPYENPAFKFRENAVEATNIQPYTSNNRAGDTMLRYADGRNVIAKRIETPDGVYYMSADTAFDEFGRELSPGYMTQKRVMFQGEMSPMTDMLRMFRALIR